MRLTGDINKVKNLNNNISSVIPLLLTKIGLIVQNAAKENSPYLTGTLRRSISTDFDNVNSGIAIVGSSILYSRIREYENKLHPDKKFYLKRAYTENKKEILDIVRKYLSENLN